MFAKTVDFLRVLGEVNQSNDIRPWTLNVGPKLSYFTIFVAQTMPFQSINCISEYAIKHVEISE